MDDFDTIQVETDGDVGRLTLDRPEKKNALSPALLREALDALGALESEVRVVVFTGTGDAFCAGMDLEKRFREPRLIGPEAYGEASALTDRFFRRVNDYPVPTIAKINGWAFGGGYELQALCDFAIADEDAVFGLSEINFGVFPGAGAMWTTVHSMPRRKAKYYVATGRQFTGAEAEGMGAVTMAVPAADLDGEVADLVSTVLDKNDLALRFSNAVFERSQHMTFEVSQEFERAKLEELSYLQGSEWVDEGIGRFSDGKYRPGMRSYRKQADEGEQE